MNRHVLIFATTLAFLAATGCVPKNWIAWSPNGKTAALISDDGLQLLKPDGSTSPILLPNAIAAVWTPNSQQLLVSETQEVIWFKDIRKSISDQQFTALLTIGNLIHHLTQSPGLDAPYLLLSQLIEQFKLTDNARAAIALYLQDEFDQEIPPGLLKREIAIPTVTLLHHNLYDYSRNKLTPVSKHPALASSLLNPDLHLSPRFSPDGQYLAYLASPDVNSSTALWVTSVAAPASGSRVESLIVQKAVAFDWSPDSKILAYLEPLDTNAALVALRAKAVRDSTSQILTDSQVIDIAGLLTASAQFLRVLPDGQILFLATSVKLPLATSDFKSNLQFYRIDPKVPSGVTQLTGLPGQNSPELARVTDASLSPDGQRVAYADSEGRAGIIDLATSEHTPLQTEKLQGVSIALVPAWRTNSQLTFVQRNPKRRIGEIESRVAMYSKGKIISFGADWPREAFASRLGRQTTFQK